MIVETLLGTLTGGLTSILPGILSWLQRRDELKHEQKLAEIRYKLSSEQAKMEVDIINARADAFEGESLRRHDASLDGTGFINALRRSVRPVITYLFFFLFVFVKAVAILAALRTTGTQDWLGDALLWNDLMPLIWDDQTSAIFGAIIGFWFGGRAIEKLMRR
jgi:hypothetical protein